MTAVDWHNVKNFKRSEFITRDDPDASRTAPAIIAIIDSMRTRAGVPIVIHAAYARSGHSKASWHYKGLAVDLSFRCDPCILPMTDQLALIEDYAAINGVGCYLHWAHPGWHIDLRPDPRLYWFGNADGTYSYFRVAKTFREHLRHAI